MFTHADQWMFINYNVGVCLIGAVVLFTCRIPFVLNDADKQGNGRWQIYRWAEKLSSNTQVYCHIQTQKSVTYTFQVNNYCVSPLPGSVAAVARDMKTLSHMLRAFYDLIIATFYRGWPSDNTWHAPCSVWPPSATSHQPDTINQTRHNPVISFFNLAKKVSTCRWFYIGHNSL